MLCELALAQIVSVVVAPAVRRVVLEDLLGMRAHLGAYAGAHVLSHLFPVLPEQSNCYEKYE